MSKVRRNPFEVASFAGATVVGFALIAGLAWPDEVEQSIPLWFDLSWGIIFIFGALCSLIGARIKSRATGIVIEQIGLAALAVTCFMGGILLGFVANDTALWLASVLFFILGGACVVQWYRIESTINSIIKKLRRTAQV